MGDNYIKLTIPVVLLVLLISLFYCKPPVFLSKKQESVTLVGKVEDLNNNAIPNCKVELTEYIGKLSYTDQSGAYSLEVDDSGEKYVEFKFTHSNYDVIIRKIKVDFNTIDDEILISKVLLEPKK